MYYLEKIQLKFNFIKTTCKSLKVCDMNFCITIYFKNKMGIYCMFIVQLSLIE